jgi:hypothetical protein
MEKKVQLKDINNLQNSHLKIGILKTKNSMKDTKREIIKIMGLSLILKKNKFRNKDSLMIKFYYNWLRIRIIQLFTN